MRKITEIIIHCTATKEGQNFTVDDIRRWHRERGFNDCGYHLVVRLDGSIEIGRPIETVGAHCIGHNSSSIGIAYVGGLDEHGRPKDTRTAAQKVSLSFLVQLLRKAYPESKVYGHYAFSNKACPCFDVSEL